MPLDVDRLLLLGFFRHVPEERRAAVLAETRELDFAFASDDVRRWYSSDAEDLAEGGVRDQLGPLLPFLEREGVRVDVEYREVKVPRTDDRPAGRARPHAGPDGWFAPFDGAPVERLRVSLGPGGELHHVEESPRGSYVITIGPRRFVVWDSTHHSGDSWQRATVVTADILNTLLAGHGSSERAWALYGGNDLIIAFATPEQAAVINAASAPRNQLHDGTH